MRAASPSRQQSQRTTRRAPSFSTGFQPVSSQSWQDIAERSDCNSVQVRPEVARALRAAQLVGGFRLDLPDALAREPHRVADLLQRARIAVAIEPEAQLDHFALLVVELAERAANAGVQPAVDERFFGRGNARLRQQLAELDAVRLLV